MNQKRYFIQFSSDTCSDIPEDCPNGFTNRQKAIDRARIIFKYKESYTNEYIGGTLCVIDNNIGEAVWQRVIRK